MVEKMFEKYQNIVIDEYMIMPNHIHGIINIVGAVPCSRPEQNDQNKIMKNDKNHIIAGENTVSPLQDNCIGQYISWFKRMTTTQYIQNIKNNNWQP